MRQGMAYSVLYSTVLYDDLFQVHFEPPQSAGGPELSEANLVLVIPYCTARTVAVVCQTVTR